jgi:broad specificity phosphatase PhoE
MVPALRIFSRALAVCAAPGSPVTDVARFSKIRRIASRMDSVAPHERIRAGGRRPDGRARCRPTVAARSGACLMVVRLLVVAHGRVGTSDDPAFGDPGPLLDEAGVEPIRGRLRDVVCGPERACRQTADTIGAGAGAAPRVEPALAGPDPGDWTGRTLRYVLAEDPLAVRAWLSDPQAAPHRGESLTTALARVGGVCDQTEWPAGRTVLVVTPSVARLAAIHALAAPADLAFRFDVRFGGRFELSRADRGWRLILG